MTAGTIVTTTSDPTTYPPHYNVLITNDGTWLAFWYAGSGTFNVSKSIDRGITWTQESAATGVNTVQIFTVDYDPVRGRGHITYTKSNPPTTYHKYFTNSGTTLTWSTEHNLGSLGGAFYVDPEVLGNGNIIIVRYSSLGVGQIAESTDGGDTWGAFSQFDNSGTSDTDSKILPLSTTTGDCAVVFSQYNSNTLKLIKRIGGVWGAISNVVTDIAISPMLWNFKVDYDASNNLHLVYVDTSGILQYKKYNGTSWGANIQISVGTITSKGFDIQVDKQGKINVFYIRGTAIYYQTSSDGGSTFGAEQTLDTGETTPIDLNIGTHHAHNVSAVDTKLVTWIASTTNLRFDYFSIAVATTTVLASNNNPSSKNDNVTLTATVSPIPTIGITVTFKDNGVQIGTGSTNASGIATMSISTLSKGTHPLTAVFSGDSSYATSTSPILNQIVNFAKTAKAYISSRVGNAKFTKRSTSAYISQRSSNVREP
jgi:hypothetical protein